MPARRGTKGYYTNKIANGTITEEEIAEYRSLLAKEQEKIHASERELSKSLQDVDRFERAKSEKELAKRAEKLGRDLIKAFGDDVEVSELAKVSPELVEDMDTFIGRLSKIEQPNGQSLLQALATNMNDDLVDRLWVGFGYDGSL